MARPFRFRPSRREIILQNNATTRFYAGASERPDANENLAKSLVPEPPKRHRVKRCDGKPIVPLEADVVRAIGELLAVHPRVLFAVRQNSGAASYEAASGKWAPIWFYRVLTSQPVTITDFWGLLRPVGDGPAIPFCLEAKREGWSKPRDSREQKQALFISLIQNCGGVSGFVRNVDEAKAILETGRSLLANDALAILG